MQQATTPLEDGVKEVGGPAPEHVVGARKYAPSLNPEYPTGWWAVALSKDVATGRVAPLRIMERDLVLWRGQDDCLHCQAAHCVHLGAHMGYGGAVVDGTLQCPFHGFRYDADGVVAALAGPFSRGKKRCLPSYRLVERYGLVYLWNGDGEPDYEVPDLFEVYGLSPEKYDTVVHRLFVPIPAKYFLENIADGMHLAFAHGAGEWGDCAIKDESATTLVLENRLQNQPRWFTWSKLKQLYLQGEIAMFFTPVLGNITITSFGVSIHVAEVDWAGELGRHAPHWTPIEEDSHYLFVVDVVPRIPIPLVGKIIQTGLRHALRYGHYATAAQDVALMMHRREQPAPAYTPYDRGLIAFRRRWDSRIESTAKDAGDGIRSNGARAGIRLSNQEDRR